MICAPPEVVLACCDLRVAFRVEGELVEAVRGVSLEIRRGETLAVVGESGSGKSVTAGLILINLVVDVLYAVINPAIRYD